MESYSNTYIKKPLRFAEGIPVFSPPDDYIENYTKIAKDHLSASTEQFDNPFISNHIWEELEDSTAELIKKYSKDKDKILDIGVGTGRLLGRFPGLNRYGLDISIDYLKRSKNLGIDVCMSRIEDMPYREQFFDLVVCTDVLEHVFDLNYCIEKILSVLKNDGLLILRVPFKEDLKIYLNYKKYKYVHLRNFDEYSLRLLFERVFNCEFVTATPACIKPLGTYFNYKIPYLRISNIFKAFIWLINLFSMEFGRKLTSILYSPIEINIIFKK
jgi:SAM-dependent methyltransferase